MSCEVIQMNQKARRVEDMGVRFFLLTVTDKALLIDSGMTVNSAKDIAEGLTDPVLNNLSVYIRALSCTGQSLPSISCIVRRSIATVSPS